MSQGSLSSSYAAAGMQTPHEQQRTSAMSYSQHGLVTPSARTARWSVTSGQPAAGNAAAAFAPVTPATVGGSAYRLVPPSASGDFSMSSESVLPTPTRPYQTREKLYYQADSFIPASARKPASSGNAVPGGLVANASASMERSDSFGKLGGGASASGGMYDDLPPTSSLYDMSMTPDKRHALGANLHSNAGYPSTDFDAMAGHKFTEMRGGAADGVSSSSAAAFASAGLSGEADPDDFWVTVFGFSGPNASAILSHFKLVGQIQKFEIGQGNWIHLQYTSKWSAQKALAKNGTVLFGGSFMIGVIPMKKALEELRQASSSFMSPLKASEATKPADREDEFKRPLAPFATASRGERSSISSGMNGASTQQRRSSTTQMDAPLPMPSIFRTARPADTTASSTLQHPPPSLARSHTGHHQTGSAHAGDYQIPNDSSLITRVVSYIFGW